MNTEESIQTIKEDMKEIKEALKDIKSVLNSFSERFISNEKDLERMINEYVRLNADYKEEMVNLRQQIREQDDLIWAELRRCQGECRISKKDCKTDFDGKIEKAVVQAKKDMKGWLAFAILSAIGAILFSVISKIVQGVLK
jgi:uncharacterized protein (DUF342 family)